MLTRDKISAILLNCYFPNFNFVIGEKGDNFFVMIECDGKCNVTGVPYKWNSRKWLVSPHATESEVVLTVFKAIMTAMEHEIREMFTYKGVTVMNPHLDIDKLVEFLSKPENISERDNGSLEHN